MEVPKISSMRIRSRPTEPLPHGGFFFKKNERSDYILSPTGIMISFVAFLKNYAFKLDFASVYIFQVLGVGEMGKSVWRN